MINLKLIFEEQNTNKQVVIANSLLFKELAENEGMTVSDFDIHEQKDEKLVSNYFICTYEINGYKIRIANHPHNDLYDNDTILNIILDKFDPKIIEEKFNEFKNNIPTNETKTEILNKINNSSFAIYFVRNYQTNPKWFPKVCEKYDIDPIFKKYDWFKTTLQNKCLEISKSNQNFFNLYKETHLSNWKQGEKLSCF